MRKMACFMLAIVLVLSSWASNPTPAFAQSAEGNAYNSCVNPYNNTFRSLGGERSMYAGADSRGNSQCFWAYNSPTLESAQQSARNSCYQRMSYCYEMANTYGLTSWAEAINDNPNYFANSGGGGGRSTLGSLLDGATAALGIYNALNGNGGGGGSYDNGGSASNSSACAQLRNNANVCRQQWQDLGGGTTGQAGAQYECYQLYTNAYNAQCQ